MLLSIINVLRKSEIGSNCRILLKLPTTAGSSSFEKNYYLKAIRAVAIFEPVLISVIKESAALNFS